MFSSARVCYTLFITISTRKGGRGLNQTSRILEEVKKADDSTRVFIACEVGGVRLIDNILLGE